MYVFSHFQFDSLKDSWTFIILHTFSTVLIEISKKIPFIINFKKDVTLKAYD